MDHLDVINLGNKLLGAIFALASLLLAFRAYRAGRQSQWLGMVAWGAVAVTCVLVGLLHYVQNARTCNHQTYHMRVRFH